MFEDEGQDRCSKSSWERVGQITREVQQHQRRQSVVIVRTPCWMRRQWQDEKRKEHFWWVRQPLNVTIRQRSDKCWMKVMTTRGRFNQDHVTKKVMLLDQCEDSEKTSIEPTEGAWGWHIVSGLRLLWFD